MHLLILSKGVCMSIKLIISDFLQWKITSVAAFWNQIHGVISAEEYADKGCIFTEERAQKKRMEVHYDICMLPEMHYLSES